MNDVVEKPAKADKVAKALKMYEITFHSGEGDDSSDVVIGWNCKLNQYKRNVKTFIDENFLSVLKDAVVYTTVKDDKNASIPVTIPRYSYTVSPI